MVAIRMGIFTLLLALVGKNVEDYELKNLKYVFDELEMHVHPYSLISGPPAV